MKRLSLAFLTIWSAACSTGGTTTPDARPRPDARPSTTPDAMEEETPDAAPPPPPDAAEQPDAPPPPPPDARPADARPADARPIDAAPPIDATGTPDSMVVVMPDAAPGMPDAAPVTPDAMAGTTVTKTIGVEGGTLTSPAGITVDIPRHALDHDEVISITERVMNGPTGAYTPVAELGPAGLVFSRPVSVSFLVNVPAAETPSVFLTTDSNTTFEPIGGDFDRQAGKLKAKVVHFSRVYAGKSVGTRTIWGTAFITFIEGAEITNLPFDLTDGSFSVAVDDGAGGFTQFGGFGKDDGTFFIPDVPEGDYFFAPNGSVTITNTGGIDLGFDVFGRPDGVEPTLSTKIIFNVTNMAAWANGDDELDFFAPNVDTWTPSIVTNADFFGATGLPAANATSLSALTLDSLEASFLSGISTPPGFLIDGSKGDRAVLVQHIVTELASGIVYFQIGRVFEPASFTQVNGMTTTLNGAFVDVSTALTANINYKGSQFKAVTGTAPTGAAWLGGYVQVNGQPGDLKDGAYTTFPGGLDVLYVDTVLAGADDFSSAFKYGMPTVGQWGVYAQAVGLNRFTYTLPGATAMTDVSFMETDMDLATLTAGAIAPKLGPVGAPMIGGKSLMTAQTAVGLTPTVTWTDPTLGNALSYQVVVLRLINDAGDTTSQVDAVFNTTATSLDLPEGLLETGVTYYITFIASDVDGLSAPSRFFLPQSTSGTLTATFTP